MEGEFQLFPLHWEDTLLLVKHICCKKNTILICISSDWDVYSFVLYISSLDVLGNNDWSKLENFPPVEFGV